MSRLEGELAVMKAENERMNPPLAKLEKLHFETEQDKEAYQFRGLVFRKPLLGSHYAGTTKSKLQQFTPTNYSKPSARMFWRHFTHNFRI